MNAKNIVRKITEKNIQQSTIISLDYSDVEVWACLMDGKVKLCTYHNNGCVLIALTNLGFPKNDTEKILEAEKILSTTKGI